MAEQPPAAPSCCSTPSSDHDEYEVTISPPTEGPDLHEGEPVELVHSNGALIAQAPLLDRGANNWFSGGDCD
jgi:hypothetical protein